MKINLIDQKIDFKKVMKVLQMCLVVVCFTAFSAVASAQQTVSGTVTDDTGEGLPGVNVVVKGTTVGVMTDFDGKYTLNVPNSQATLVFSFVGYNPQEVSVAGKSVINVTLKEDVQVLDEVVVVGYGVQKKSDVTGSISSVKTDDLQNRTVASADQALQGQTSGVLVLLGSGRPGAESRVRVRGFSSNASSDPLYVVDGVRVTASDVAGIDPNVIESMEILKDAASAAIYGAQAGNGVVLITTKKGQSGTSKVTYDLQYTTQSLARTPKVLNAKDYIQWYTELQGDLFTNKLNASGYYGRPAEYVGEWWDPNGEYAGVDTDWVKEGFEKSKLMKHTLQFQGANSNGSYYLSGSYYDNNGIVKGDKDVYDRVTLNINGDYNIKKWLKVGSTLSVDRQKTINSVSEGSISATGGSFASACLMFDPLTPVTVTTLNTQMRNYVSAGQVIITDEDGNYFPTSMFFDSQNMHPLANIARQDNLNKTFNIRGSVDLTLTPFKGFSFVSRAGYRFGGRYVNNYSQPYTYNTQCTQAKLSLSSTASRQEYIQWENFANYTWNIAKNAFTVMLGTSYAYTATNSVNGSVDALTTDAPNFRWLSYQSSSAVKTVGGNDTYNTELSYFGRINWDYDGRYMLQASLRADAADLSRLSPEMRWGYFPAVSAGWVVTKENFMSGINKNGLSYLKLRASWGRNGSIAGLGSYSWRPSISTSGYYNFIDGTTMAYTTGSLPSNLGNSQLKWETSEQVDFGLDARFLKDRLTLTADYYVKQTKDLIMSDVVPSYVLGNTTSPMNGGHVENKGWEFDLGWKDRVGKFGYSISANLATLKNEVTWLTPAVSRIDGAYVTMQIRGLSAFQEGYPVWYFRGWNCLGIDPSNGAPIIEDVDGDGLIGDGDMMYLGKAMPDGTYGITLNLDWFNFDFLAFASGAFGNQIFQWMYRAENPGANMYQYIFDDRWTPQNTNAKYPAAAPTSDLTHYFYSNAMVHDANYLKIKQIQLGYTFPKSLISKISLSSVRAYVSLEDFFIITKYPGFDPETTGNNQNVQYNGIDAGSYPTSRKVVLGVNVSF
jgi:TonB-linked SusC/RagA family outer membrane protein